ncbi:sodium/hydrogen exchanger family protein [Purpureocillium lavendulum]|uniref:Sodium/hydrogen exchanger family protein n=1 Tax=Purpureocillium lavendulum TaxID=1247861 RepID=A0AB34G0J2_9HYPO|nr:sodium/hydrogen exchanger family protein [Purpureocillium lavendulum]
MSHVIMSQHATGSWPALAYHEPPIATILIQSSFILASNILNQIVNSLLYCGLIGQILIGVAYGTSGGAILSDDVEAAIVQLGYIGLILLVFEGKTATTRFPLQCDSRADIRDLGGLATDFRSLKANIFLSIGVAVTGIGMPIALSFVLGTLIGASNLECFAAGAALCSTSLGTTFTVLRSSGLSNSRLGVVLASAAMLDDVVGLVMVQVVANLGGPGASISATTVLRPVLVSLGFAAITPLVCFAVIKPTTVLLNNYRQRYTDGRVDKMLQTRRAALVFHTALLLVLVASSSYAGTSNLFAAYIAGAVISWWDAEVPHVQYPERQSQGDPAGSARPSNSSGYEVYAHYYDPVVQRLLQPFFFGSIGFSIPITRMFSGDALWKGVVYAILMCIAKLTCGLCLVRFPGVVPVIRAYIKKFKLEHQGRAHVRTPATELQERAETNATERRAQAPESEHQAGSSTTEEASAEDVSADGDSSMSEVRAPQTTPSVETRPTNLNASPHPLKPLSLYPAAIMGCAMVARGEIGFLISAIAESQGVFGGSNPDGGSDIFLVVTWAIVLCTILGPLGTGLLVRRVKGLERERNGRAGPHERRHTRLNMPKEKNYNPVQAQRKADKAKAIKKDRIQQQIDDLKAVTSKGGKLSSREEQVLEGLEKELKAVKKARDTLGDKAPTFNQRRDGDSRHGVLGKRRRGSEDASSDDDDVPEDVQKIPMPRDTPPPIPKDVLDVWFAKRRARRNAENAARQDNREEGDKDTDKTKREAPAPTEHKTVYEAKPVMRDLRQEAVSAFVPAAVQAKMMKGKGQGGLMEPEEADQLEREGYLKTTTGAGESPANEAPGPAQTSTSLSATVEEVEDEDE